MALIEIEDVTKGFFTDRRKTEAMVALEGLNLSIEEGEFVSLIGPSGCGKTVSLSLMAGFIQPTSGSVMFKGEPVTRPDPHRGVVFQEYSLFPWLSVVGNLVFALRSSAKRLGRPFDKEEARQRSMEALASVNLSDVAERRPNTLSGGMKQRVAIARLLAMDSDVFLMDEPFSALDEQTRAQLDQSLFELWRERHKTIVFVTHNISEAVQISSRIVLFSKGPGHVIHEWHLADDLDRAPASPEMLRITQEIRALLPSVSSEPDVASALGEGLVEQTLM